MANNQTNNAPKSKKLIAAGIIGIAVLSGAAGALTNAVLTQPQVQEVIVEKNVTVEVPYEVEVIKEIEVPVNVTQLVEVEDTEFLGLVCDRLLFDDLKECKAEVESEDVALKLALEELDSEFAREAFLADLIVDDRKVELVRVYDKFDEMEITRSDFDRNRYTFVIEARLDDIREDERVNVKFEIDVDNGRPRIVDVQLA